MNINGILPYFGAKRTLAPQIVTHFGPHEMYYEPFAGSLACLFAKLPARNEVVSEANPDVANLIKCLSTNDQAEWLWSCAQRLLVSEAEFNETAARLTEPMTPGQIERGSPVRALDFLRVSWQGLSGIAGTTTKPKFAKRNTSSGGSVAARWRAVAPAIPEWHERLRAVEFRCADAFELLPQIPDRDGVTAYVDPPYFPTSRTGGKYACDFTMADHERLSNELNRFKLTRVVLSLYDCPDADRLYAGWRKVRLEANRTMKHTKGGEQDGEAAGEVLFINKEEDQI